jgi:hypothetical protein
MKQANIMDERERERERERMKKKMCEKRVFVLKRNSS